MKFLYTAVVFLAVSGLAGPSFADAYIAYPLNGGSYTVSSAYPFLLGSFSVNCKDMEDHDVDWGYGSETLGHAKFRGQISVQFLQKYSRGTWVLWVKSECGSTEVKFAVSES